MFWPKIYSSQEEMHSKKSAYYRTQIYICDSSLSYHDQNNNNKKIPTTVGKIKQVTTEIEIFLPLSLTPLQGEW